MLFVVGASLSFHAGSPLAAAASTRAPVVSMGPAVPSVGDFVYGSPVPLSSGYSRSGTPNTAMSFKATGAVGKPTARAAAPKMATTLAGDFVYGNKNPLSHGVPGFSIQNSFPVPSTGAVSKAAPTAKAAAAKKATTIAGDFVYGNKDPLSLGVPGFSIQNSFPVPSQVIGKAVPTAPFKAAAAKKSGTIAGDFVYGNKTPLSLGVPGFSIQNNFPVTSK